MRQGLVSDEQEIRIKSYSNMEQKNTKQKVEKRKIGK